MNKRTTYALAAIVAFFILAVVLYAFVSNTKDDKATTAMQGTVTYLERSALPEGSVIEVSLEDTSRADAPAIILAETTIVTEGENVPIPFTLSYDSSNIEERATYSLRVRILIDNELRFINTSAVLVLTNGNPSSDIEVLVSSVSSSAEASDDVSQDQIVACTMDVKECADGSFVSRTAPSCTFAACPGTASQATIVGSEWTWQYTEYLDGSRTTPEDSSAFHVRFGADGKFSSGTDCNTLVGNYIVDNEILSIGPIASTKMSCGNDVLESKYSTELSRTTSHVIDGNELQINLVKDSGTMVFARVPSSTLNLNGTNFRLFAFNEEEIPVGANYTLLFEDTSLQARFCNGLGGTYTLKNGTLTAPLLIGTKIFCEEPENLMEMEESFGTMLEDGVVMDLEGSTLTLSGEDEFVFTVFMD